MSDDPLPLQSAHVRAVVYRTAGLFAEARFRLPSGRWVEPLAKAPWSDEPDPDIPGHLRRLGGEFFCLPFGGGGAVSDPSPGWEPLAAGPVDVPMHGPAANADWQVMDHQTDRVTLSLDYPSSSPVRRVERSIALAAHEPRARIAIRIEVRQPVRLPAAFHPIVRLPDRPGGLQIDAIFERGFTYPGVIDPDRMACEPGQQFSRLNDAPKRRGGRIDLARLPLGPPTEDVVLLAGMEGPIRASFVDEGFALEIDWSRPTLPHCMMWIHDRGADGKPWGGRYRGLGLEPLAAAFDGPARFSAAPNPLAAAGFATAVDLTPDAATTLTCALSVHPVESGQ